MKIQWLLCLLVMVILSSCGYSSRHNEMTGQVKKVVNQTPIICGERVDADVSLGVMRNGVGTMSTQDVWFTSPNPNDQALLAKAAENGSLVKITYDVKRITLCREDHLVTHVELLQ